MAVLTQEMKDLVSTQQCFVGTVSPDGTPDVGPKRSTRVLDDEHLMFTEITGKRTWTNVQNGSKVAIAVVDKDRVRGYRFLGTPEVIKAGELFDQAVAAMKARGMPSPKAVVRVRVDKIFNLGNPGAGEEIG